jgi:phage FluMu protein Com
MFIGYRKFRCYECNHVFRGPAAEYHATVLISPIRCEKCGSFHTAPCGVIYLPIYKYIWKKIDAQSGLDINVRE